MAGLTTTFLNNVTRNYYLKTIKNNLYNGSPLFKKWFLGGRIQTMHGAALQWTVILKKHQAVGRFTGYDTFANQPINPTVDAQLLEGSYYAAMAISGTEERKNSGNVEKLQDMVKIQHDNAIATLQEVMYTDLYSDGSLVGDRRGIYGLKMTQGSLTNTYAGINRSTAAYANWKPNLNSTAAALIDQKDPTSAKYLPSLMRSLYSQATHNGKSPGLIITSKNIHNNYQDIYGTQILRGDNKVADLGFGAVNFSPAGVVMFDDNSPANYMWFINEDDYTVYVYSGANFDMPEEGWMRPPNQDKDQSVTPMLEFSGSYSVSCINFN